jgi:hypothetical protein
MIGLVGISIYKIKKKFEEQSVNMYIPDISSLFRAPLTEQLQNVKINCKLQTYSITQNLIRYKWRQYEKAEEAKHNKH